VEPAQELSAVTDCDESKDANAVLKIVVNPSGRFALNLFQSGRVDLFAMDGLNGRPKRRPVLTEGGQALAFRPSHGASFFVAARSSDGNASRIEKWDLVDGLPRRLGILTRTDHNEIFEFLGFSADGLYLVALDQKCTLSLWTYDTAELLLRRPAGELPCPQ